MTDKEQLDRTYHYIMKTFIDRGNAPHYTEIAGEFGVKPGEGKKLLHDLMNTGMAMWLYPGVSKNGLGNEGLKPWRSAGY